MNSTPGGNIVIYIADRRCFRVTLAGAPEQYLEVDYPFDPSNFAAKDGAFSLFSNSLHSEASVFKVKLDGYGPPGYLFTVSAIASREHSFTSDVFFRGAAFAAIEWLLSEQLSEQVLRAKAGQSVTLGEVIDPELSVLALHKVTVEKCQLRSNAELFPYFLTLGFAPTTSQSDFDWKPGDLATQRYAELGPTINVKRPSHSFAHVEFIERVFFEMLSKSNEPIFRFYLFYQLIELLLEDIFRFSAENVIDQLHASKTDLVLVRNLLDKLGEQKREKARLKRLFNEFSNARSFSSTELMRVCNSFIASFKLPNEDDAGNALYMVRNLIIHNLRCAPTQLDSFLIEINGHLEVCVPSLLIGYQHPVRTSVTNDRATAT